MRGRQPALSGLLLWVVLAAMTLVALPRVTATSAAEGEVTLQHRQSEDRGGELPLHEPAPVKLRRTALQVPSRPDARQPAALLAAAPCWTALMLPAARRVLKANDWPTVQSAPPTRDAPGRRQQRGQAPPQA
ncbi:hypothetical protein [Xanthomonas sp. 60]